MRWKTHVLIAVLLSAVLVGCSRAGAATPPAPSLTPSPLAIVEASATPEPSPTASATVPTPTRTATPTPTLTPTLQGRLPAVVAEIPLALPGGDAYEPQTVALDEDGQAVVLCYYHGAAESTVSALVTLNARQVSRGQVWPLPGRSIGPLAAAHGLAYLGYEDGQRRQHLIAVDLASGQTTADVTIEPLYSGDPLLADPAGRLYLPLRNRLEVRDGVNLRLQRTLPYGSTPRERTLAADFARGRLYLASDDQLRAYRIPDLRLLWEAKGPGGSMQRLVVDRAGQRLYAYAGLAAGGSVATRLLAFDAESGRALEPLQPPGGAGWELVAADSRAGYLVLGRREGSSTLIWQADLAGRPTGPNATILGYATLYAGGREGLVLALVGGSHLVRIFDMASLRRLGEVPTGVEIRHLVADPQRERAYLNDSAGRLHVVNTASNRLESTLQSAGSGSLALDAANHLLFVSREPGGREVTVVDTAPLAVTGVITGGDRVAIDSAGHRAFVGWTATGPSAPPGEVQVWDTRSLKRTGAIAHRGEPSYNPLRDEIYLRDYSAYVVDGKTLKVTGELTPDVGQQAMPYCNGCLTVGNIAVDAAQDVIVVDMLALSAGKGPGSMPQPRLFSARTRQPVTHTVTVLSPCGGGPPFIIPADRGRTYVGEHYARYVAYHAAVAYPAGRPEPADYRDGLSLDLYLLGGVALSVQQPEMLAFDAQNWQPLGWLPYQCVRALDLTGRRLYAWERSTLTVLTFDGGRPAAPQPSERLPIGKALEPIREIHLSPAFERDRTAFIVAGGQVLRSTDGGARWSLLRGGLPSGSAWSQPTFHLALSPAFGDDRTLFAGGHVGDAWGLGVWRSTDAGETWAPVWAGLQHLKVDRLVVSPRYAEDQTLLAYTHYNLFWQGDAGTSLFRSRDGGSSWSQVAVRSNMGTPPPLPQPETLLPMPTASVQFRLTEQGNGVSRSTDGGKTWQTTLLRSEPGKYLLAVVPSPRFASDRQVFALSPDLLYRSTDGGVTWEAAGDRHLVRTDSRDYYTALAVGRLDAARLVVFVGDQRGVVLPLDPGQIRWAASPAPTPAAMATRSPSVTPCAPAAERFAAAYSRWGARLGCPTGPAVEVPAASQRFERGRMFWRSDTAQIYVLQSGTGGDTWSVFPDTWQEGQTDRDPTLRPPAGREQPIRGFGKVWRELLGGPLAPVGWAVEGEVGYGGQWQPFAGGVLLTAPEGKVYALFADGRWERE